jgi:hypothetical protein
MLARHWPSCTFSEGPQLRKINPPRIERIECIERIGEDSHLLSAQTDLGLGHDRDRDRPACDTCTPFNLRYVMPSEAHGRDVLCILCVLCVGGLFSVIRGSCKRYAVTPTCMPSHEAVLGCFREGSCHVTKRKVPRPDGGRHIPCLDTSSDSQSG